MNFFDKLKLTLPFSYMRLLKDSIGGAKTILDLGCEDGRLLDLLSGGADWKITGVDIYKKNTDRAAKRKIYEAVYKGDVVRIAKKLKKERKKYDVVFCSQVIEHIIRKDGEELLKVANSLAKKRIVMGTPRGFMEQPEVFLGHNPHMVHKSGWTEDDFKTRGYKVYGVGFGPVWSEEGLGRSYTKPVVLAASILSYILAPVVYYLPSLAAGILCIKDIKNEK